VLNKLGDFVVRNRWWIIAGWVVIAVAIGIIVSTSNDASTYVGFDEALSLSTSGNKKEIHVVGELKKDDEGHVIGITEGAMRVKKRCQATLVISDVEQQISLGRIVKKRSC